ncbi:hypothetical protein DNTS_002572 [Danionella cerebrum]|uniref:CDK5 regulatory subunit-associated protein 3 n=1 Tax=Danionella cerebrum TaxID=2873325 RepID=A0A553Q9F1_9TELE|nr:hypothetical protein DNTS_002572 [Danionella translucida]TRY86551.1 hypothetical protein DNTS_002572 [Danionella translucida]
MENIQNLPIDIQTSKLLDWLVDRRHCTLKWQSAAITIREKINAAIQDMPENEDIKQLLAGSYIHYFHCLKIVEILRGTEASTKNIFGKYSSQRMKDWQEIVSMYEKDSVYLAEVASILVRNVNYEGPSLRKQVSKAQQLQQELSRREMECQNECGKKAASLKEAIEFYAVFTKFVSDWSEEVLLMLRYVQSNGNTTVYEWKTGNVPTVVERPVMEEAPPDVVTEETIDWGVLDDAGATAAEEVHFGTTVEDGVDWGINLEPSTEAAGTGGIDWGDSASGQLEIEVVDVGTDCPDGVARGEDALSVLEYSQTRGLFIDELMERLAEGYEEDDLVAMSQFQLAPSLVQAQTPERVKAMLADVRDLLSRLTSVRMQHLFMIQASPRYVERVSELLRQKLKQADILVLKRATLAEKRQEALEEQAKLEPRIDLLAARTKELQKMIEADISKRYNHRPVNLMGVNV